MASEPEKPLKKVRTELVFPIYLDPGTHRFENWGCKFSVRIEATPGSVATLTPFLFAQYLIHWPDLFEPHWFISLSGDVDRLKMILIMKGLLA